MQHTNTNKSGEVPESENERLLIKIREMKHRICLLEFGIGTIAKVILQGSVNRENPVQQSLISLDGSKEGYKKAVEGICRVLFDVEQCFRIASERRNQIPAKLENISNPISIEEVGISGKTRIFIDETQSGKNTLTDVCGIKLVQNSTLITSKESMGKHYYNCPTLDALSTLAAVATTKAKEGKCFGETSGENSTSGKGTLQRKSTPFVHSQEGSVPFKKRKINIVSGECRKQLRRNPYERST